METSQSKTSRTRNTEKIKKLMKCRAAAGGDDDAAVICISAVDALVEGRVADAKRTLEGDDLHPLLVHTRSVVACILAILSEDAHDVEDAHAWLARASSVCAKKSSWFWSSWWRSEEEEEEAAFFSVWEGERKLFQALLEFRMHHLMKGALHFRQAFKDLQKGALFLLDKKEEPSSSPYRRCVMSSVCFGLGFFLFSTSMIPPSLLWIVEAVGFSADRIHGFDLILESHLHNGHMSPLARLAELATRLWIFLDQSDRCSDLVREGLQRYQESPLYLFFLGYCSRASGHTSESCDAFHRAHEVALVEMSAFSWACLYERAASTLLLNQWQSAAQMLQQFLQSSKGPSMRCWASFLWCVSQLMLDDRNELDAMLDQVISSARNGYSYDAFACKCARMIRSDSFPSSWRKVVIGWTLIESGRPRELLELLGSDQKSVCAALNSASERRAAVFLCGLALRQLKNLAQAKVCFHFVCNDDDDDDEWKSLVEWLVPYAWTELAEMSFLQGDLNECKKILKHVKSQQGYDFEKPLRRRLVSLQMKLE